MKGDASALAALVEHQRPRILGLAACFARNAADAEDLAQDILVRLVQALPRLSSPDVFDVWIYRLGRNRAVDGFRRRRFEAAWPLEDEPSAVLWSLPARHPDASLERADALRRLRAALRTLPPAWRRALVLRDLVELSYEEVAARLQLPIGTAKSQVSRGRARLASALARPPAGPALAGAPVLATLRPGVARADRAHA